MNFKGEETRKAKNNFIQSGLPIYSKFIIAYAQIKLACAKSNMEIGLLNSTTGNAIIDICSEIINGKYHENIIADPLQGGAGTSFNMNMNELIAFFASINSNTNISPIEHVNLHQSTNDTYGTALKIAIYSYLIDLEEEINQLLISLQEKEKQFSSVIKMARTQLIPAIPCTLGQEFSAYSEMIGRDRWRIFKAQERIRQINLGGTAIGTGITAPKQYIALVNETIRKITNFPLARAENLFDATQNHDQLAEVVGMIKVVALNLEKISNDLRYLTSIGEISLAPLQKGSSIMPSKINPIIPEMISSISKKILGNELTISLAIKDGQLELNSFLPLIAHCSLESLDILCKGINKFNYLCIKSLIANEKNCYTFAINSPTITTILIKQIGYYQAEKIALYMQENNCNIFTACEELSILNKKIIEDLLKPERLLSLGE
jgi:aspartate ammonia-lyase